MGKAGEGAEVGALKVGKAEGRVNVGTLEGGED